jgi:hypothetical protein
VPLYRLPEHRRGSADRRRQHEWKVRRDHGCQSCRN